MQNLCNIKNWPIFEHSSESCWLLQEEICHKNETLKKNPILEVICFGLNDLWPFKSPIELWMSPSIGWVHQQKVLQQRPMYINYTWKKIACFSSSLQAGEGIDRHLMQFNNALSLERNIPEDHKQILLSFGPHIACHLLNEIL